MVLSKRDRSRLKMMDMYDVLFFALLGVLPTVRTTVDIFCLLLFILIISLLVSLVLALVIVGGMIIPGTYGTVGSC